MIEAFEVMAEYGVVEITLKVVFVHEARKDKIDLSFVERSGELIEEKLNVKYPRAHITSLQVTVEDSFVEINVKAIFNYEAEENKIKSYISDLHEVLEEFFGDLAQEEK